MHRAPASGGGRFGLSAEPPQRAEPRPRASPPRRQRPCPGPRPLLKRRSESEAILSFPFFVSNKVPPRLCEERCEVLVRGEAATNGPQQHSALLCTAKAPHSDFHSTALGSRLVVVLQLTDTTLQAKVSQALELSLPSFLPSFRRQKGLRTDPCLGTPIPAFAVE